MLNFFKGKPGRFTSEKGHKKNLASQTSMSPKTMAQLRKHGVTEDEQLKLEYFFYTNTHEKAEALNEELLSLGYAAECGESAHDKNTRVITGWTTPMDMTDDEVVRWTAEMCNLGHKHDCEFDGWGTNPEQ